MSLPAAVGSSVQVDSEGWISWGRGPCGCGGEEVSAGVRGGCDGGVWDVGLWRHVRR